MIRHLLSAAKQLHAMPPASATPELAKRECGYPEEF
jgi:hypothetical protein